MSLQVWLPLNGDLHNQGLLDFNQTINTAPTWTNDGKIGKAMMTGAITMPASAAEKILNNQAFSFACWIYVAAATGSTTDRASLFGQSSMNENNNRKFSIFQYPTCNDLHLSWMNDAASTTYTGGTWSGVLPSGKWTHLAITYQNPAGKIYINGVLYRTFSGVSNSSSFAYNTPLFANCPNNGRYLNDYRIYDHCLSAKEVEEIAKGLVLHYKLDGTSCPNQNLLQLIPKRYANTEYLAYQLNMTENLIAGQTYTLQLWDVDIYHSAKTIDKTGVYVFWGGGYVSLFNWYGSSSFIQTTDTNYHADYLIKTFTPTSAQVSGNGAENAWLNIYNSVPNEDGTKNMYIGAWKLEKGNIATPWNNDENIVYDSSGYNNDGIIVGGSISSDTIRHSTSTNFTNSQYIYVNKHCAEFLPKDAITVNLWQNSTSWANPISCTEGGGFNFENAADIRFPVYMSGVGYKYTNSDVAAASLNGSWHMLTGTVDSENIKLYIDGELKTTTPTTTTAGIGYANNYLFIAAEASGNTTTPANSNYVGNISDVRIYATALTPEQILELYHTSATIDNMGNVYARELVEE